MKEHLKATELAESAFVNSMTNKSGIVAEELDSSSAIDATNSQEYIEIKGGTKQPKKSRKDKKEGRSSDLENKSEGAVCELQSDCFF